MTLTETTKAGRRAIQKEVQALCDRCGMVMASRDEGRDIHLNFHDPATTLEGFFSLQGKTCQSRPNVFVVHWYMPSKAGLRISSRFCPHINQAHFCKATDICRSVEELLILLGDRFNCILEGCATEPEICLTP
jgi:hypothetical protein